MKLEKHFLVASIETTCWREHKEQPAGEKNEIIEIGVVPLALKDLKIGTPTSILIKPSMSRVSKFCTTITSITPELADTGISFKEACEKMRKDIKSKDIPWISWGAFDPKMLHWQCSDLKVEYPFGAGHVDWKFHFAAMMGLENETNLPRALEILGMKFEGTRHRAGDEAYNIARVVAEMFKRTRQPIKEPAFKNFVFDVEGHAEANEDRSHHHCLVQR